MSILNALKWAALAALTLGVARSAAAADYEVSPVRIDTSNSRRTAVITLRNLGTEVIRLQVSAMAWTQEGPEDLHLVPTSEVTFFPSLLTLKAGESRQVRVGTPAGSGEREKAYRLVVEQLPALASAAPGNAIQVLTRMTLPVFVAPEKTEAQAALNDVTVHDCTAFATLRNSGNTHLSVKKVHFRGTTASGHVVVEKEIPGWYVLPGTVRLYSAPLPHELCTQVEALGAQVETDLLSVEGSASLRVSTR